MRRAFLPVVFVVAFVACANCKSGSSASAGAPSASTTTAAPAPSSSTEYASSAGKFRITFPEGARAPRERTRKINGSDVHLVDSEFDGDFFGVLYSDYPHAMVVDKQQNLLVDAEASTLAGVEGEAEKESTGLHDGDPTRTFSFHTKVSAQKHMEHYGKTLLVLHGDRVYTIAVSTKNREHLDRGRVDAFLDSFAIVP